jgi:hypothetical protein
MHIVYSMSCIYQDQYLSVHISDCDKSEMHISKLYRWNKMEIYMI